MVYPSGQRVNQPLTSELWGFWYPTRPCSVLAWEGKRLRKGNSCGWRGWALQPSLGQGPNSRVSAVIAPGCPVPVQAPASALFLGPQGCCSCSVSQFQRQLDPSLGRGWRLRPRPAAPSQPLAGGFLFFWFEPLSVSVFSGGSAHF